MLLTEQLRLHARSVLPNVVGAACVGVILVTLQSHWIAAPARWAWLGCLAGVITLRLLLAHAHARHADKLPATRWLRRYRQVHLASGMVWGLAGWLLFPPGNMQQQTLLAFVLAGMAASAIVLYAFDLKAALYYAVPTLLPLAVRLLGLDGGVSIAMGAMVLVFLVFMSFVARRAHLQVLDLVRLRDAERQRADEARHSEQLLHTIFRHVAEGIAVFDGAQRLVAANDQCQAIGGIDGANLRAGTPLAALLPDANTQPAQVRQFTRADGRCIELRRSPVPGGGCVTLFVDITQRVHAETALADKQRMLTLLMETTQEGFWFIDNALRTTDLNAAMCQMLGRSRDDIIGRDLFEFVDDENAAVFRRRTAERNAGVTSGYEISLLRPDGTQLHCFNNATPVFDARGKKVGAVGLFTDISAQKHAQAQAREALDMLARQSSVLQMTLNSMAQGILSLDAQGRCTAYNQRLLELLELPASLFETLPTTQQIAQSQKALGHFGAAMELLDEPLRAAVEDIALGEPEALPPLYVRRTHAGRTLEVQSHRLPDGCVVRTFSDITAQVDAQAALRASEAHANKLALVAAHTDSAVSICDAQGRVEWVNKGFERLTGYALGDMLGQRVGEMLRGPETIAAVTAEVDERMRLAQRCSGENINYTKQGRRYWVGFDIEPVRDTSGQVTHFIASERNISARKAAEAALVTARDEAERANRAKSQFLSRMSHELRTPMNAILGFGQLLESDAALPPRLHTYVHELMQGGNHLLNLINEVLDLARIEAGQFQLSFESVDLRALCRECMAMLEPLAEEQRIDVQCADAAAAAIWARADRMRLKQVVLNLLSNAIKYNRAGGTVRLQCSVDQTSALLHVHDTGHGLQAQQLQRLFKPFERLDAHKSAIEGSGIGLALSRRLAQVMHGDIGVHSEPGVGSHFWVQLPAAAAAPAPRHLSAPPAAASAPAPDAGSKPRTVLYIEDDAVNQMLMQAMLEQLPRLRLLCASLPQQGLEMARSTAPELILLDIQLPGMDGYEVLRQLRACPVTRHTPVIAVSANAMHGDIEQGLNAGFCQYLTKPLEMGNLLDAVSRQLRRVEADAA